VQKYSIEAIAKQQIDQARNSAAARAATTVYGGHEHALRQTVVGLKGGAALAEHDNPGEGTVYVLSGRVTLATGDESWEGRAGDLIVIPHARHTLTAEEDSAVLLTAVPGNRAGLRYMCASVTYIPVSR
jgi:quercetin dioxygenase-like cupin family protein